MGIHLCYKWESMHQFVVGRVGFVFRAAKAQKRRQTIRAYVRYIRLKLLAGNPFPAIELDRWNVFSSFFDSMNLLKRSSV